MVLAKLIKNKHSESNICFRSDNMKG